MRSSLMIVRPAINEYDPDRAAFEVMAHGLALPVKMSVEERMEVFDFSGEYATRERVEDFLKTESGVKHILFLGHGHVKGDRTMGQGMVPCFDLSNASVVAGCGCYFICCHAGRKLGNAVVANGGKYFIGLSDRVYLAERRAEWIVAEALLYGLMLMIRNVSVTEAFDRLLYKHDYWIKSLVSKHTSDMQWKIAAAVLDWNMEHLVLITPKVEKGGYYILRKFCNPIQQYTKEEIAAGVSKFRAWITAEPVKAEMSFFRSGDGDSPKAAEILATLEKRLEEGSWGQDDIAERTLAAILEGVGNQEPDSTEQ